MVFCQDCKKYKKWLLGNIPQLAWPNQGACPFNLPPTDPIGHFTINGVKLNVPREYITFDPNQPDGAISGLSMFMQYPTMKPATGMPKEEGRDYNVRVSIEMVFKDPSGRPLDESIRSYEFATGIKRNREQGKETNFKLIKHHKDLGLDEYVINDHEADVFYIKGNQIKPEYWIVCTRAEYTEKGPYPHCEGWFNYNDKIYINYFFPKWIFFFA